MNGTSNKYSIDKLAELKLALLVFVDVLLYIIGHCLNMVVV